MEVLVNGGQGWGGELCEGGAVESCDRDVLGNAYTMLLKVAQQAEGHFIIRAEDSGHIGILGDFCTRGVSRLDTPVTTPNHSLWLVGILEFLLEGLFSHY